MKHSEDKSKRKWNIYDETEESLKRLVLRYDPYIQSFDDFLNVYNEKTDGDEKEFLELELEVFDDVQRYLSLLNEDDIDSYQVYDFEKRYKQYLEIIRDAILHINTLGNSLERKCAYLTGRLNELTETSENTLGQRLLLIKYLERSHKFDLSKIHPDATGQAQVLKFLMNVGYQNLRSGLGRNIDNYKNKKDLNKLLELLTPYSRYFQDVIADIKKDLEKINL